MCLDKRVDDDVEDEVVIEDDADIFLDAIMISCALVK